jgi:hypothetical protein
VEIDESLDEVNDAVEFVGYESYDEADCADDEDGCHDEYLPVSMLEPL